MPLLLAAMAAPSRGRSVPAGSADDVEQRRPEPRGMLDGAGALEVDPRAALVGLVRGIEGDGHVAHAGAVAHGEAFAATLIAQARADRIEALDIRVPEVCEARLVPNDLYGRIGDGFAAGVL